MSAGIVYEGRVQSSGGTLFKNLKFWVALRVPQRPRWIQDIENNGGSVVKLEKLADYLIADHARKDAPAGSISWKLIEESVKQGKLLDADKYVINPPGSGSRPVGSVQQRSTRTAFTTEDDAILFKYVTKRERLGTAILGNSIYKTLEQKYPHHTFQSWRDRWVKKLQHLPRPDLSSEDLSPSPEPQNEPTATAPTPSQAASPSYRRPGRNKFTVEEDELLLQYIQQCQQDNKPLNGSRIFKDLAEDLPQHTWQSWRERWIKQLRPRLIHDDNGVESFAPSPSSSHSVKREQGTIGSHDASYNESQGPTSKITSKGHGVVREKTGQQPRAAARPRNDDTRDESSQPGNKLQLEKAAKALSPVKTPQKQVARQHSRTNSDVSPSKSQGPLGLGKEDFYQYLQAFRETETQPDQQINFWPTIQGRTFELWAIWEVVQSLKVDPEERDWQQVAESLGYDWIALPNVPEEIRQFYEINLSSFEESMASFEESSEEDDESNDDGRSTPERSERVPESSRPNPHFNSSPPRLPSLKRSLDASLMSDQTYPESPRKRSRLDRAAEVPSTPDHINGTAGLRHSIGAVVSPMDERISSLPKSSRASKIGEGGQQGLHQDDDTEDSQSQVEVTPSQQLHSENDAALHRQYAAQISPTPRRIVKTPFIVDDDQDEEEQITPKPRYGKGPNPLLSQPELLRTKRQSVPTSSAGSLELGQSPEKRKSATGTARFSGQSTSSPHVRASATLQPEPQSPMSKLKEVVEYWMSLGYSQDIARRSLEATTWEPGLAGQVMQLLKGGEPMPKNWEGVWSARDDDNLKMIDETASPSDDKQARKRQRATDRLMDKHGEERIALRRKWLATKIEHEQTSS